VFEPVKTLALRLFGRLPRSARRFVVRSVTPTYTAGTAAIIEREDGRWLFVRPAYRPAWALPGGLLDRNEAPEPAIHRELREELGLVVVLEPDPWVLIDPNLRRLDIVWRARPAPGVDPDAIEIETYELVAVGWFDPDDPPELEDEAADIMTLRRRHFERGETVFVI
jgi:ADP-ribose pyrophosphatase YjhB (NUDIX family)